MPLILTTLNGTSLAGWSIMRQSLVAMKWRQSLLSVAFWNCLVLIFWRLVRCWLGLWYVKKMPRPPPKRSSSHSLLSLWFLVVSVVLVGSEKGDRWRTDAWGDSCPTTTFFPSRADPPPETLRYGRPQWWHVTKISTTKSYTRCLLWAFWGCLSQQLPSLWQPSRHACARTA